MFPSKRLNCLINPWNFTLVKYFEWVSSTSANIKRVKNWVFQSKSEKNRANMALKFKMLCFWSKLRKSGAYWGHCSFESSFLIKCYIITDLIFFGAFWSSFKKVNKWICHCIFKSRAEEFRKEGPWNFTKKVNLCEIWPQIFISVKFQAENDISPNSQEHLTEKDIAFSINNPLPH